MAHEITEGAPPASRAEKNLRRANTLLLIAVVVALSLAGILGWKYWKLRARMFEFARSERAASASAAAAELPKVGDLLPGFDSSDNQGHRASIRYDGSTRYLLFIFSPQCEVCTGEYPTWGRIAQHATSRSRRVVALSVSPFGGKPPNLPIDPKACELVAVPDIAIQRAYRAFMVPVVLLVSPEGRIEWVQNGKLSNEKIDELMSALDS